MNDEAKRLAEKIVAKYKQTPRERRLLVAVAGAPGSGKSTIAYPLTDYINTLLQVPPEHPSKINPVTDIAIPTSSSGVSTSSHRDPNHASEIAICVGLDGWHYSRKELDEFEDPVEAHWRRGAAFTFNLPSYTTFLNTLREPIDLSSSQESGRSDRSDFNSVIPFPTFSHSLKDPLPSTQPILPNHRIIVIEGLYTLLDKPGWRDTAQMMDIRVWVECDRDICRNRLIRRNFEAGIVDDLKKCEERVDASDMVNGDEVRSNIYEPTDIVHSIDDEELLEIAKDLES